MSSFRTQLFRPFLTIFSAFLLLFWSPSALQAQNRFASQVISYTPGTGSGIFVPANILGGPQGAGFGSGSLDVATLGVGGSITVGFDVTIADGPGADFTVFENGFEAGGGVFAEVAWVEVSTDAVHFARLPCRYAGPPGGFASTVPYGTYSGLPGGNPVLANVATNSIHPFDPAISGGDAFDLAELANDPLVTSGVVDLDAIHYVRLVDVPHGTGTDSYGNVIWDSSGAASSADYDAVAVIQHTGSITPTQPLVDLFFDASGYLNLKLEDPNGFTDLDRSTLHASFNLRRLSYERLRLLLPVMTQTPNGVIMRTAVPFVGSGRMGSLAVSIRDLAGQFSADQIAIQG